MYRALVEQWLMRDQRKGVAAAIEEHEAACRRIALELMKMGKRELGATAFENLCAAHPETRKVKQIDLQGRSLLNTNDKGEYRFSHYSIQEYLAVAALLDSKAVPPDDLNGIPVTGQMVRFARAWVESPPLAPNKGDDKHEPPSMTLTELVQHARAARRGLLLAAALAGALNETTTLPEPGRVPRPSELGDVKLPELDLRGRKLAGEDLRGAYLAGAVLQGADLSNARLGAANVAGANLSGANLSAADLSEAELSGASLEGVLYDLKTRFPPGYEPKGPPTITASRGGYELVAIPGGVFVMGSPADEEGRSNSEGPEHRVELATFYLGKHPVTNEEYALFLKERPRVRKPEYRDNATYNAPRQPVVGVSYDEAKQYCDWAGLVLPTEAQWEYACRGGAETKTRFWSGDAEADLARVAWYAGNAKDHPEVVGQKAPNAFGLYDMHGNVWEWCQDWFGSYEERVREGDGLRLTKSASYRVLRGGCFCNHADLCRSAYRDWLAPGFRDVIVGFRPARVIT